MSAPAIQAYLVAAGDFHDVDFPRLELLKLLAEHENIRTTVASDYSDIEGIQASDFLVSYTINLIPSEAEQAALKAYVESGKNGSLSTAPIRLSNSRMRVWHAPKLLQFLWKHWAHSLWPTHRFSLSLYNRPHQIIP